MGRNKSIGVYLNMRCQKWSQNSTWPRRASKHASETWNESEIFNLVPGPDLGLSRGEVIAIRLSFCWLTKAIYQGFIYAKERRKENSLAKYLHGLNRGRDHFQDRCTVVVTCKKGHVGNIAVSCHGNGVNVQTTSWTNIIWKKKKGQRIITVYNLCMFLIII